MEQVYVGRQSIVYSEDRLFAYEVLYRDKQNSTPNLDERFVSASVINNILNKFGTQSLLGNHKAFVKINYKFLMSDLIFSVPKDFFVFSILSSINIDDKVTERIHKLHEKNYKLCIDDVILNKQNFVKYRRILDELSYLKVNFRDGYEENIAPLVSTLKFEGTKIIASNVNSKSRYEQAKRAGCEFFQGDFLASPNVLENKKYDPKQFNILKLYNLLIQDTNIDEITAAFENNHAITIQLLQFINSGYFHFRNKISSIHHVLTLVGRRPLSEWLMLMVYSKSISKSNEVSPLMLLVKNRTELMQNTLKVINPNVGSNALGEAYFVGVLSLVDVVFCMKLEGVLEHMYISDDVKDALLEEKGLLGDIYKFVKASEAFDTDSIATFATRYKIKKEDIEKLTLESMEKVNSFANKESF